MKRKELYNLVWSKPMTHIGKEFGMSDVAVGKHCKKHDIPTPPVGYWAKLAYGKNVRKPPLPNDKQSPDALVKLSPRDVTALSLESKQAAAAMASEADKLRRQLRVPKTVPDKPHSLVREVRAALNKTKQDSQGFLNLGSMHRSEVYIGGASIDRTLRILSAITRVAEKKGHHLFMQGDSCYWQVEEERFAFRIYEIKGKQPHEPTAKELKDEAWREERRARYPDYYATDRKSYRSWDYFPSGRLAIYIKDTNGHRWDNARIERRWQDRKTATLESSLVDIFIWLASATIIARDKRLEIEEKQRVEAEAAQQRQRERQRQENAKVLRKHINELADIQFKIAKLASLADFLSEQPGADSWASKRFVSEVLGYRARLLTNFQGGCIEDAITTLGITEDDDLLINAL